MRKLYVGILSIIIYIYFAIQLAFAYIQILFPCDCLFDSSEEDIEKDNIWVIK